MKFTSCKIAIASCIALSFSSTDLLARGGVGGHSGGGGGGGGGHHGGGGGGGGGHPGGGSAHAPAISRTPSFSHPNPSARTAGSASRAPGRSATGIHPATGIHANPAAGLRPAGGAKVGAQHPGGGARTSGGARLSSGARLGGAAAGTIGGRGAAYGTATNLAGGNHARITSRPYAGNALNYGNHSFNLAQSGYRPSYYGHGLYHGYWNGNYGFGGGYGGGRGWGYGPGYGMGMGLGMGIGYGLTPLGWGYGGWGLGAMGYNSGYLGYSNPYYDGSYGGYNYAQPIPVDYGAAPMPEGNPADAALNDAVAAFKQNDYDAALDIIDKGIAQYPTDSVMHEFRALVLFAEGDYQQAAATIHSVLAIGPGWDWTTLASLYTNLGIYTDQLRTLRAFVGEHPQDGAARFLLAYHYMIAGHTDAAAAQLQQVVTIAPGDRVAADLAKMLSAPPAGQPAANAEEPAPAPIADTQPAATPIDATALLGSWHATRADGSKFELTLTKDATFTWKFSPKKQPAQELSGSYTVEVNVLALECKDGGSLIGQVTPGGAKKFNFTLEGAPREDEGLDFSRPDVRSSCHPRPRPVRLGLRLPLAPRADGLARRLLTSRAPAAFPTAGLVSRKFTPIRRNRKPSPAAGARRGAGWQLTSGSWPGLGGCGRVGLGAKPGLDYNTVARS